MGSHCNLPTGPLGPALMGLLAGLGHADVYQSSSKYSNTLLWIYSKDTALLPKQ